MRDSTISKHLALILGYFGVSANLGGTIVSFLAGLLGFSKAKNYILDTLICLVCTIFLAVAFFYLCFKKKKYARFISIANIFSGFVSFPAMFIVTGNFICGFPFYIMIIPVYYGFSVTINKLKRWLPVLNYLLFLAMFILTFKAPFFPGRLLIPNLNWLENCVAFTAAYFFLFYVCYLVANQFMQQNQTLEESEQRYKELSSKDELTGLYNRRSLANRAELGFSCAIIYDIDYFKNINDTYGHQTGDKALQILSQIVLKYCSNEFELFRYGGEEFVILSRLPDDVTLELFQHVMHDVRMNFIIEGNPVTISAGIASFCKDYNRTLKIADENLYLAKTDGRNKIYMNGDEIRY